MDLFSVAGCPTAGYCAGVMAEAKKVRHLYLHVPFCARKCGYCGFYSAPGSAEQMQRYVQAVKRELELVADDLEPETIFWGGGTPSVLPERLTEELLIAINRSVPLGGLKEWAVEANPATISDEKARLYLEHGVNRISMGVQSLDDNLLKSIGRIHTRDEALRSYERLRAAGFGNVSLDVMFGLPGQTLKSWETTLREVIALCPEHISAYCLILEEDTEFWDAFKRGLLIPDEETETKMFVRGMEILGDAGYAHYEISNYALPGREAQHNIAYWRGRDYYGLGPSACSTVRSRRWTNEADTERYVKCLLSGCAGKAPVPPPDSIREDMEELSPLVLAGERIAFGLRMMEGVSAIEFKSETGLDLTELWADAIGHLIDDGLLEWDDSRLRLTQRGILFADEVAAEFVVTEGNPPAEEPDVRNV